MRSNHSHYNLTSPGSLSAALEMLASEPGLLIPIAGGTELMVAFGAGRLTDRNFLSINGIEELRFIEVTPGRIIIGSGSTFTDIRKHPVIQTEFPLLERAASWTGSIANQNRGTLGGNIVNASPAADSPPALLVYNAEITLTSIRGIRTLPYTDFHLGYKKTVLAPDELVYSLTFKRDLDGYVQYIRKVGTRNAQAISKVALAAIGLENDGIIQDVRIAAASLRDRPTRLPATEQAIRRHPVIHDSIKQAISAARAALFTEIQPIDDIRSTANYRAAVAGNLLEEFLFTL